MTSGGQSPAAEVDVLVVGAGVVGLGHAVRAVAAGASVMIIERDARAVGASVRNFGHICITPQSGAALEYGLAGRAEWIWLSRAAGFWLSEAGTVVVARTAAERAVLEDFAHDRGDQVVMLDPAETTDRVAVRGLTSSHGGAWLPLDLRVDPRQTCAAIASWLADQGVHLWWSTTVQGIEDGVVLTSRGPVRANEVVVAVGHDVDQLFPAVAREAEISRCSLHMMSVDRPTAPTRRDVTISPAVLTGFSLLRYSGFGISPALTEVRRELTRDDGAAVDAGLNLMFTQLPDGRVVLGDTHSYSDTVSPFQDELHDELILRHARGLFGGDAAGRLVVRERWQGVYASAPEPFLINRPSQGVTVVAVTTGIGMTTAFGLAAQVMTDVLAPQPSPITDPPLDPVLSHQPQGAPL